MEINSHKIVLLLEYGFEFIFTIIHFNTLVAGWPVAVTCVVGTLTSLPGGPGFKLMKCIKLQISKISYDFSFGKHPVL